MARKREEFDADLPEGKLTHNPFAALRPGSAPGEAEAQHAPTRAPSNAQTPVAAKSLDSKLLGAQAGDTKIVVRHESKGHGGKTVTRVAGLAPGTDLVQLARELSKAMGAGARESNGELVLQGKQVERVATWLEARGYARVVRGN